MRRRERWNGHELVIGLSTRKLVLSGVVHGDGSDWGEAGEESSRKSRVVRRREVRIKKATAAGGQQRAGDQVSTCLVYLARENGKASDSPVCLSVCLSVCPLVLDSTYRTLAGYLRTYLTFCLDAGARGWGRRGGSFGVWDCVKLTARAKAKQEQGSLFGISPAKTWHSRQRKRRASRGTGAARGWVNASTTGP